MPVSITDTVKVYHCAKGNRPLERQIEFGTHYVRKSKLDGYCNGDRDGDGMCKWTLPSFLLLLGMSCEFSCKQRLVCINLVFSYHMAFLPPANECCEGYVFTRVCLSTGGWVVSQHALQVVSQHALQQVSGGGSWGVWPGGSPGPHSRGKLRGLAWGVCSHGGVVPAPGGCLSQEGEGVCSRGVETPLPPTANAEVGTHPTGMHSCRI